METDTEMTPGGVEIEGEFYRIGDCLPPNVQLPAGFRKNEYGELEGTGRVDGHYSPMPADEVIGWALEPSTTDWTGASRSNQLSSATGHAW